MPLKAVFLDIDGTLVDSNEFNVMAWQEALGDHGHSIPRDKIRLQIGKGADQLLPSLLPELGEEAQDAIALRQGEIFKRRYLGQVKPFPRARELIAMIHAAGKKVILASSSDRAEVEYYAQLLKAEGILFGIISRDEVENSKPAGDIFAAALAEVFPLAASETFAVGDTPYDVESALRSGIKTIAVRSGGFSGATLAEAGASYIYASVKELYEKFHDSPLGG